jgi:hypothetical protein
MASDDSVSGDSSRRSSSAEIDPDIQRVLKAWPTLREALRAGILAMIDPAQR